MAFGIGDYPMGASEGTYQPARAYKSGAGEFTMVFGARYHPFRLATVLWERKEIDPVDIYVEVLDGDKVYAIDEVIGCVCKKYAWPNSAAPSLLYLVPDMQVRFRVTGAQAAEEQSVLAVWAELGAV